MLVGWWRDVTTVGRGHGNVIRSTDIVDAQRLGNIVPAARNDGMIYTCGDRMAGTSYDAAVYTAAGIRKVRTAPGNKNILHKT